MSSFSFHQILPYLYKGFLILMLTFGLVLSFSTWIVIVNIQKTYEQLAEAQAEVVSIEQAQSLIPGGQNTAHSIVLNYSFQGEKISKQINADTPPNFSEGDTLDIFIDPENPHNATFKNRGFVTVLYIYLGVGILISIVCGYLIFSKKERLRRSRRSELKRDSTN